MTPEDFDRGFYSTSIEAKAATLKAAVGSDLTLRAVADAICDGAGGCEQLVYGDLAYNLEAELISPMYSDLAGCTYAYVKWVDGLIRATAIVTLRPIAGGTEDSAEMLAYALSEGRDVVAEQDVTVGTEPF